MCGIAGYYSFNKNKSVNRRRFEKMVDLISHRGPDDRGTFYQDNLALGHRRLSIIGPGKDGHQPFFYKDRYVIVYNGEIYNYMELREELCAFGYQFHTNTDTEVLAAAYDHYGKKCVHHLNGMWSFAVFDRQKEELYCSRDRFGVKPFYYYFDDTHFIFGSEIKQILYMMDGEPQANRRRLLEFLICGDQDYTDETMFLHVMQLCGGYEMQISLKDHKLRIAPYYELGRKAKQGALDSSYKEDCAKFRAVFQDAVRLRLRADVPVGYCLSGGLDSSAIVSVADGLLRKSGKKVQQHAVSSCFENPAYDEQEYIDEVIRRTGICSHKVYPDGAKLFDEVDQIIWHMDEPFGSTSIYAQWNVFREARENGLAVMLDGQGADEQLAGYSAFYGVWFAELLRHGKFFTFFKELRAYQRLRAATETYVNAGRIIRSAVLAAAVPAKVRRVLSGFCRSSRGLPFRTEQLREIYKNRNIYQVNDARQYMLDSMKCGMQALLHYEDRDSMAFSIESRVPFLDYRLAETIYQMPFSHKIRRGTTKAVLRDGLRGILPEKIRTRYSKLGFVTPEDEWIRHNYEQYRRELEDACDALSGLLDKQQVMQWFDKKKAVRGGFTAWRIICAGRWVRVFHVLV